MSTICKQSASGCNYPEGECAGLCIGKSQNYMAPVQMVEHAQPADSLGHKVLNAVMAVMIFCGLVYLLWGGR